MGLVLSKDRSVKQRIDMTSSVKLEKIIMNGSEGKFNCIDELNHLKANLSSMQCRTEMLEKAILKNMIGGPGKKLMTAASNVNDADKVDKQVENPLLNFVVLQGIISQLDHPTSLNARLVCKTWNYVTIPILSTKSKVMCSPNALESLADVDLILTTAPPGLFREAWLEPKYIFQPECQVLLADYGPKLRALKLQFGPLELRHLRLILVDWCLNLEVLDYNEIKGPELKTMGTGIFSNFDIPRPLNLIRLTLAGTSPDNEIDGFSVQPLVAILKSSPKLEHLKFCTGSSDFSAILNGVRNIPNVAKHLRSLRIDTFYRLADPSPTIPIELLPHQPLLEALFGNQLRILVLYHSISLEWLPQILEKFKGSLETVILYRYDRERGLLQRASYPNIPCPLEQFPKMNKLTTFKNFSNSTFPMTSINFVKCMDNLETLILSGEGGAGRELRQIDELFKNCVDLQKRPHQKLKSLSLRGKVTSIKTLSRIRHMFPSLKSLYIELGSGESDWVIWPDKKTWIQEAIRQISMMKALQSLHLHFKKNSTPDGEAFLYLRNMSHLEHLAIQRWFRDTHCFPSGVEEQVLSRIPNLRKVTLIGFMMLLTDAKMLMDSMAKRNILLELSEFYEIPTPEIY